MPVYAGDGRVFENEKEYADHLNKLRRLQDEGKWNEWLLLAQKRSCVTWTSTDDKQPVVIVWIKGRDGVYYRAVQRANGKLSTKADVTAGDIRRTIRPYEARGRKKGGASFGKAGFDQGMIPNIQQD